MKSKIVICACTVVAAPLALSAQLAAQIRYCVVEVALAPELEI